MDNAERMCDSVCIIANGEKVLDGGVAAVRDAHGARMIALSLDGPPSSAVEMVLHDRRLIARIDDSNRYLELELAEGAKAPDVLTALVGAGAAIERFELVRPSLHRIFLEKVGATHVDAGMSGHG
jgi:ABC-2 type transport system ATP-binding protein